MAKLTISGPDDQIQIYKDEANEMRVTNAEYGRLMIQAGRRELGFETPEPTDKEALEEILRTRLLEEVAEHSGLTVEELTEIVTEWIEVEVKQLLSELQDSDTIRYSPVESGYVLEQ